MCCNRMALPFFLENKSVFPRLHTASPLFYLCLSRTNGVEINLIDLISTYAHMKNLEGKDIDGITKLVS